MENNETSTAFGISDKAVIIIRKGFEALIEKYNSMSKKGEMGKVQAMIEINQVKELDKQFCDMLYQVNMIE